MDRFQRPRWVGNAPSVSPGLHPRARSPGLEVSLGWVGGPFEGGSPRRVHISESISMGPASRYLHLRDAACGISKPGKVCFESCPPRRLSVISAPNRPQARFVPTSADRARHAPRARPSAFEGRCRVSRRSGDARNRGMPIELAVAGCKVASSSADPPGCTSDVYPGIGPSRNGLDPNQVCRDGSRGREMYMIRYRD